MTSSSTVTTSEASSFRALRYAEIAAGALLSDAGDLTLGAWSNFPFDGDKVPDSSDPEIDLYGSYTFKFNEEVSIAPGFTSYHFPNAPESLGFYKWTFEPNLALNYTVPAGQCVQGQFTSKPTCLRIDAHTGDEIPEIDCLQLKVRWDGDEQEDDKAGDGELVRHERVECLAPSGAVRRDRRLGNPARVVRARLVRRAHLTLILGSSQA